MAKILGRGQSQGWNHTWTLPRTLRSLHRQPRRDLQRLLPLRPTWSHWVMQTTHSSDALLKNNFHRWAYHKHCFIFTLGSSLVFRLQEPFLVGMAHHYCFTYWSNHNARVFKVRCSFVFAKLFHKIVPNLHAVKLFFFALFLTSKTKFFKHQPKMKICKTRFYKLPSTRFKLSKKEKIEKIIKNQKNLNIFKILGIFFKILKN